MKGTWRLLTGAMIAAGCRASTDGPVEPTRALELSAVVARTWTPVDLGNDPFYFGTVATAISASGTIAGYSYQPYAPPIPWVMRPGSTWRYLKPLPGDSGAYPSGVNSHGLMSGTSQTGASGPYRPVYWADGTTAQAVPGITSGQTYQVSESGWIVGDSYSPQILGFRYRPGQTVEFLQPDTRYPFTKAYSINDAGYAVGESNGPVVWTPSGQVLRIPVPPAFTHGAATHINNRGDIVGYFSNGTALWTAFVKYRSGPVQLLTMPTGMAWSFAFSVDARGTVFGWATQGYGYQTTDFVWENGIPSPVPQWPGALSSVYGVNECGVMVGSASIGGTPHALRWDTTC